ncbi:MAG: RNA 2',3'-cyclic phosphodiesterase [Ruminococcaceae bacterium]|nr:RNA 2',3'-cyclic phosphodiesterase [Oscillospiraceae bacterium]
MRLFIAINFTEPFKKEVLGCQADLRRASLSGNFSRPENLHMTLAFIGEVRDASGALRAVKSVRFEPFELKLKGSGRFGNLWWIGADSGKKAEALAAEVRDALRREGVPFDAKPFKPHITVAREVETAADFSMRVPEAVMTVSRISLMKSERINGRLVYSEIK